MVSCKRGEKILDKIEWLETQINFFSLLLNYFSDIIIAYEKYIKLLKENTFSTKDILNIKKEFEKVNELHNYTKAEIDKEIPFMVKFAIDLIEYKTSQN
jgi:hypothetical protein